MSEEKRATSGSISGRRENRSTLGVVSRQEGTTPAGEGAAALERADDEVQEDFENTLRVSGER